jgi:hypothetical protein
MATTQGTHPVSPPSYTPGARLRAADRPDSDDLRRIVQHILAACLKDQPPDANRVDPERWEDEEYVYFGARIADPGRDVDINVHEGWLLVRLEKDARGASLIVA